MSKPSLALGIDCSTQSMTGTLLDMHTSALVLEHSIPYTRDARLAHFALDANTCLLPPWEKDAAEQPPLLFLEALDCLLADIQEHLEYLACLAVSAQQHGHVYLSEFIGEPVRDSLALQYEHCFSYPNAPIWMSSNTAEEARHIRDFCGGSKKMIDISGSDSPLRFTGAVIRRIALSHPEQYNQTKRIHLISSFLTSVLTGKECPIDFGNAAGMSLMDYKSREWSEPLLSAVTHHVLDAHGNELPEAIQGLHNKLPPIVAPDTPVGTIAPYFTNKYGIPATCTVSAGSGDNPQTKALVQGDLLSLGSSFVIMAEGTGRGQYTNAMYDGLGRPFVFACRTNGALCWDHVRNTCSSKNKGDLAIKQAAIQAGEQVLQETPLGSSAVFYQPLQESFPPSGAFAIQGAKGKLAHDYPGIVDSSLAILRAYSASFCNAKTALYLTGGPTRSKSILSRIAAFWDRPVAVLPPFGAAMGAAINAVSAWNTYQKNTQNNTVAINLEALIPQTDYISPDEAAVKQAKNYTKKVLSAYTKLVSLYEA